MAYFYTEWCNHLPYILTLGWNYNLYHFWILPMYRPRAIDMYFLLKKLQRGNDFTHVCQTLSPQGRVNPNMYLSTPLISHLHSPQKSLTSPDVTPHGSHLPTPVWTLKWVVDILLECILVKHLCFQDEIIVLLNLVNYKMVMENDNNKSTKQWFKIYLQNLAMYISWKVKFFSTIRVFHDTHSWQCLHFCTTFNTVDIDCKVVEGQINFEANLFCCATVNYLQSDGFIFFQI